MAGLRDALRRHEGLLSLAKALSHAVAKRRLSHAVAYSDLSHEVASIHPI